MKKQLKKEEEEIEELQQDSRFSENVNTSSKSVNKNTVLHNYIENARSMGMDDRQISSELRGVGWSDLEITNALKG